MLNKSKILSLLMVISLVFLTACGGGGGADSIVQELDATVAKLSGNLFQSGSLSAPRKAEKITDTVTGQLLFGGITKALTIDSNGLFSVELKNSDLIKLVAASGVDISGENVLGKDFSELGNIDAQDIIEKYSVRLKFLIDGETADIALPPSVLSKNKTTVLPKVVLKKEAGKFKYMVQNAEGNPIISNAGEFLEGLYLQSKNYDTIVSALSTIEDTALTFIDKVDTTTTELTNAIAPATANTIALTDIESRAFYYENGNNISIIGFGAAANDEVVYNETLLYYDGTSYTAYTIAGTVEVSSAGSLSKHITTVNSTAWASVASATQTIVGGSQDVAGVVYYVASDGFGIYSYNDTNGETTLWRAFQPSATTDFQADGFFAPGNVFISHDGMILEAKDSDADSTSDKLVENGTEIPVSLDGNNVITMTTGSGSQKIWRFAASATNLVSSPELFIIEYDGSGAFAGFSKATITKKTPLTLTSAALSGKVYIAIIPGVVDNNYYILEFNDDNTVDIIKYNDFNSITQTQTGVSWAFGTNNTINLGAVANTSIAELNNAYLLLTNKIDPVSADESGYSLTAQFADMSGSSTKKSTIIMREATAFATADYDNKNFNVTNQTDELLSLFNFTDDRMYDNEIDIWLEFTPTIASLALGGTATLDYLNINTLANDIKIYKLEKTSTGFIVAVLENGEIELLNLVEASTISVDVATNFYKEKTDYTQNPSVWEYLEMFNLTETSATAGTYTYTKFTPTTKTESAGTYAITDRDTTEERYTLTFTATSGTAPAAMRIDYTDMYGAMAAFEDLADNSDVTVSEGWDCWIVSKVADTDKNKFVDTDEAERAVIDINNGIYYLWEQPVGEDETYSSVNITVGDIPGGNTLTDTSGNVTYIYSLGHFGFGNPGGPMINYIAETGAYEYEHYAWDKSLDSLNDNSFLVDATYCAYFKDPRTATGASGWDELHLMTVSGSNIADEKFDTGETSTVVDTAMTWTSVDDTLLKISVGSMTINGALIMSNSTTGEHTLKMTSSDATFYETVPFDETVVSGKTIDITITQEDGTGITATVPGVVLEADYDVSGSITGTWTIERGVLKITETDGTVTSIHQLKKPISSGTGFNFFIKTVNTDDTETIERGSAVIR